MAIAKAISAEQLNECLPKKWEVESLLGHGGQGDVYKGVVNGTAAAIKLFNGSEDAGRVKREIEALQGLECKNVAKILGWCSIFVEGKALSIIAYEFMRGGDLTDFVGKKEQTTQSVLSTVGRDIANAIENIWKMRIVHRDIKPANIVKSEQGSFVLIDLGMARHLSKTSLTQSGWTCGTKGYMSPEQLRAWKQLTYQSDVYSLGISILELATGLVPEDDIQASGSKRVVEGFVASRPDLSQLVPIIQQMVEQVPYRRPTPAALIAGFNKLI